MDISQARQLAFMSLPSPAGTARTLNCGASQAATRPGFELWPARAETSISAATARSMDCSSASAAERVPDCGDGVQ